ncbi:transposase [Alicyclobacillus suci]|uniref:transposase n=1 Tax=Alicyclobacillus suci TaxID=2816080 RepID=UPI001A8EBAE7|nr:transposase [Alicyclobacillus suci]
MSCVETLYMENTRTDTPDKTENLEAWCTALERENAHLKAQLNWLTEQVRLSRHKQFGTQSERSSDIQIWLFNEAEWTSESSEPLLQEQPETETITYERNKKQSGQREE